MAVSSSFRDFVLDQLAGMVDVEARPMFGGYGLYSRDLFFGLLWGERVYLRTSLETRGPYLAEGMKPFSPGGKVALKNYYELPVDVLEDSEKFTEWAADALAVSASVPAKKRPARSAKPVAGKQSKGRQQK